MNKLWINITNDFPYASINMLNKYNGSHLSYLSQ